MPRHPKGQKRERWLWAGIVREGFTLDQKLWEWVKSRLAEGKDSASWWFKDQEGEITPKSMIWLSRVPAGQVEWGPDNNRPSEQEESLDVVSLVCRVRMFREASQGATDCSNPDLRCWGTQQGRGRGEWTGGSDTWEEILLGLHFQRQWNRRVGSK